MPKSLPVAFVALLSGLCLQPLQAAPWWEDYGSRENYLCSNSSVLRLRRNKHQATIENLSGPIRTLFRDARVTAAERYKGANLIVELRNDELELDYGWATLKCKRLWQS